MSKQNSSNQNDSLNWSSDFQHGYFYKLQNLSLYLFSSVLEEEMKDVQVVVSLFDKRLGVLHYSYMPHESSINMLDKTQVVEKLHLDDKKYGTRLKNMKEIVKKNLNHIKGYMTPSFIIPGEWTDLKNKFSEQGNSIDTEDWFNFFFGLSSPRTWYEEGIAYRILEDSNRYHIHSMHFDMSKGEKENGEFKREVKTLWDGNSKVLLFDEKTEWNEKKEFESVKILFNQLSYFFSHPEEEENFQEDISYTKYCSSVFPIYEIYIGGKGYGGIWGFCNILHNKTDNALLLEKVKDISPHLMFVASSLFESGIQNIAKALDKHVKKPSGGRIKILREFLSMIIYIQAWEKIWITEKSVDTLRKESEKNHPLEGKDIILFWSRGKKNKQGPNTYWKDCGHYTTRKIERLKEAIENQDKKRVVFSWSLENIEIFLTESEKSMPIFQSLLNRHIICEYPQVVSLPDSDDERRIFENKLENQQLQVFEIVINKWRRHMAAEQLAASAIMSRNMSHNIGSHVLAKVIASKSDIVKNEISDSYTPQLDLFSYLQSRMDHLAYVATDRQGQISHPVSFNFQRLIKDFEDQDFLCQYISGVMVGKNPLSVEIKIENEADDNVYVSVPNGNTGAHAFYIILENYIRNVAKHNTPKDEVLKDEIPKFCVCVRIDEVERYPDMVKISLWDELEKQENCYKDLLERKNKINNWIKKSIIDKDLTPREEAWGIAEMIFSAQHLRQNEDEHEKKLPLLEAFIFDSEGKNFSELVEYNSVIVNPINDPCLVHEFYMSKPKEILIISDDKTLEQIIDKDKKEDLLIRLQKCGIKWLNECEKSEVAKYIKQGYQRLVWLKDDVESLQNLDFVDRKSKFRLPTRTFVTKQENKDYLLVCKQTIMKKIESINKNTTEEALYNLLTYLEEQWCNRLKPDNNKILFRDSGHTTCLGKAWFEANWNEDSFRVLYHRHNIKMEDSPKEDSSKDSSKEDPPKEDSPKLVKKIQEKEFFFVEVNQAQSRLESIWDWDWTGKEETEAIKAIKNFYKHELLSAALTKIVILDERIQEEVDSFEDRENCKASDFREEFLKKLEPSSSEINVKGIVAAALNRVHVPSKKDVDLYKPESDKIIDYVKETNSENDPVNCIVIHWGVLQKIKYNEHKPEEDFIQELKEYSPSVRVCTGRGRSMSNFEDETIPFSELRSWVSSPNPSKYHLCKLLNL